MRATSRLVTYQVRRVMTGFKQRSINVRIPCSCILNPSRTTLAGVVHGCLPLPDLGASLPAVDTGPQAGVFCTM